MAAAHGSDLVWEEGQMLKVQRSANGQVVFRLSGRIDAENIPELEALLELEANGRPIVFDLKDLLLVNREGISFLERCEMESITLRNCPAYVREWITRQRQRN